MTLIDDKLTGGGDLPYAERASDQYIRSLDGLRAIAILLVIFSHFGLATIIPGGLGVTLFFFISGLLITRLMIAEHERNGAISIRRFYLRRGLRLGPALITVIVVVLISRSLVGASMNWPQTWAALFYYMNYYILFGGVTTLPFGIFWSLAVEEHYYLFYPHLFSLNWRYPKKFLVILLMLTSLVLIWRLFLIYHVGVSSEYTYSATDARLDSILYGAILAVGIEIEFVEKLLRRTDNVLYLSFASMLILISLVYRNDHFRDTARYTIQGLAFIPLFYAVIFGSTLGNMRKVFETDALVWIGRLSYSLYLWHLAVLYTIKALLPHSSVLLIYPCAGVGSIIVASSSYYFVEQPFQKVRKKFRY